jgi:Putative neutral zinc metallopeptidase
LRACGQDGRNRSTVLDPGDVDQALQTASAIGDDRLQKKAQGYVVPDSFTHGASGQRKRRVVLAPRRGAPRLIYPLNRQRAQLHARTLRVVEMIKASDKICPTLMAADNLGRQHRSR